MGALQERNARAGITFSPKLPINPGYLTEVNALRDPDLQRRIFGIALQTIIAGPLNTIKNTANEIGAEEITADVDRINSFFDVLKNDAEIDFKPLSQSWKMVPSGKKFDSFPYSIKRQFTIGGDLPEKLASAVFDQVGNALQTITYASALRRKRSPDENHKPKASAIEAQAKEIAKTLQDRLQIKDAAGEVMRLAELIITRDQFGGWSITPIQANEQLLITEPIPEAAFI